MKICCVSLLCAFSLFLHAQDGTGKLVSVYVKTLNKSKKSLKVTIDVYDSETKKMVKTIESSGKNSRVLLGTGRDYILVFNKPGYLFQSQVVSLADSSLEDKKLKSIIMQKVEVDKKTVLNNLSFDVYQKMSEYQSQPDNIYIMRLLEAMPQLKLEFGGYTCNSGSMTLSMKVSEEKAKTVVDYLVSKGVNAERVQYKGYGSFQPIASNRSQEGRILNNRVEMKVVDVKFVSKSPEQLQKVELDTNYHAQTAVKTVCATTSESSSTNRVDSVSEAKTIAQINASSETLFMPGINSNTEANTTPQETNTMAGVNSAGESTELSSNSGTSSGTEINSASETGTMPGINSASETNSAETTAMPGIDSNSENNPTAETNVSSGNNSVEQGTSEASTMPGINSNSETSTTAETNATAGNNSGTQGTSETSAMPGINSNSETNSTAETNSESGSNTGLQNVSETSTMPGITSEANPATETTTASVSNTAAENTSEIGSMPGIVPTLGSNSTEETKPVTETGTTAVNSTAGTDSAKTEQQVTTATGSAETKKNTSSTKEYKGMFIADKKPFANATVNLLTEKGKVYRTTKTDANGRFKFADVPADKKLTIGLNEKETKKYQKVKLLDSANEIFGAIDGYFEEGSTILPQDINAMIDYFFDN